MSDNSIPRFMQGIFDFTGKGLENPYLLDSTLSYVVPPGAAAEPVYFRGGNSTNEMISIALFCDGKPMRYFPIGAKGSTHVSLRVLEDLLADTVIEIFIAAPKGVSGTAVIDLGLVEI